jgi:MYXO-CTERM domain-containing protein
MRRFFTMVGLAATLTFGVASPVMAQQDTSVAQADAGEDDDSGKAGLFGLLGLLGLGGLAGLLRRDRDRDAVDRADRQRGSRREGGRA